MKINDYMCINKNQFLKCEIQIIVILFEAVPNFQLYNIFSTILVLNLGMCRFLSTFEINYYLGYTYVDEMLKISRKSKTGNVCCL